MTIKWLYQIIMGLLARYRTGVATTVESVGDWYLVAGTERVNNAFRYAAWQMAERLEGDVNAYAAIWSIESGLKADAYNARGGASGINQFMPPTAQSLGTTATEIRGMTAIEQLPYIEKFYTRGGARGVTDPGTLYMLNFLPAYAKADDSFVLGEKGGTTVLKGGLTTGKVYAANYGFDTDKDGIFTVGDVANLARGRYNAAKKRGSIPITPEVSPSSGGDASGIGIILALGLTLGAIIAIKAGNRAGGIAILSPG